MSNNTKQVSESLPLAISLTLAGGIMDAYTYMCRGKVFATAETGNLVFIGINLATGDFRNALKYLPPILAFAVGVICGEAIHQRFKNLSNSIHWRQIMLVIECLVLVSIIFIPYGNMDNIANVLISFISAVQMQTFRKCLGNIYVSTMCTGNIRSGSENLQKYFDTKDTKFLKNFLLYFLIISFFVVGAVVGAYTAKINPTITILTALFFLIIPIILMYKN